ncbi:carbohydrate ABC transporter permease [Flexivirga alba]|uniref:Carbohydrate ABC transporter permease n=1 Tax=Flexivirga alba TaxID=702742 RepID=A0ABW2AAN4_9MICO
MTAESLPVTAASRRFQKGRFFATAFMILMTVLWILPILAAIYVALRPVSSTAKYGYASLPHGGLTFSNFSSAWSQGNMAHYFLNTLYIVVPAVIVALLLASMVAFVLSRLRTWWSIALLILFTAGNLLPPQAIITPLYWIYTQLVVPGWVSSSGTLYNTYLGLIIINVTFQLGFCVFVLRNFMQAIPEEMYEAARVDGAGLFTQWWRLTLPMCRPALGALGTLLTIWIYNDFFWATVLMSSGSERPITSALNDLQGQFVSNQNQIAAAALLAAIPTLIVFLVLQRQFIAGLSLGSSKG